MGTIEAIKSWGSYAVDCRTYRIYSKGYFWPIPAVLPQLAPPKLEKRRV